MKKIKDWVKNKAAIVSIAMSNVEKNAFAQNSEGLSTDITKVNSINQGKITDSLINGEITQEVMDLRWRMYKIMEATDGVNVSIQGYKQNGQPVYIKTKKSLRISKPNLDQFDTYPIEMIATNEDVVKSVFEGLDNDNFKEINSYLISELDDEVTRGEITGHDYFTQSKNDKPIKITRTITPNFYLELYTKTLKIRKIEDTKRMLEFYVSSYPDEYNRTTRLFISAIKKEIENKSMYNPLLDLTSVSFISEKTQGVNDNHLFVYKNLVFDKIVSHNGFYVIKFIGDVVVDGEYIMEGYRREALDNKYETKEKK